ncbi:MAG: tRNA guanosine(34) transglycosylase Tgt [Calditrichaeota bacterium]|nr:MAG: tRNA guanosine(34) transglycosylase Tgt [Calditrichota bacterium]
MLFSVTHTDASCKARTGMLTTDHGAVETPAFMPVGTIGTVKTVTPQEMRACGVDIMLANTYHLYLKPGTEVLREFGGLHRFNGWDGPILTDSGGFQVYSLEELKNVREEGVEFKSHWDGSRHLFTPENVVDIQRIIGSDIMMVLDYLTGNPSDFRVAEMAHEQTLRWAERARAHFQETEPLYGFRQFQFGIIQGGIYPELRERSIAGLLAIGFDGYAIGGLAVGEDAQTRRRITDFCTDRLPRELPRYLMGVGKPDDILEAIELGVDLFDCVIPTRNARNGTVFTRQGKIGLRNAIHKLAQHPIEEGCACFACRHFSLGYIHHLFKMKEMLGMRLATIHNLYFYMKLMEEARRAIRENRFLEFKQEFMKQYGEPVES